MAAITFGGIHVRRDRKDARQKSFCVTTLKFSLDFFGIPISAHLVFISFSHSRGKPKWIPRTFVCFCPRLTRHSVRRATTKPYIYSFSWWPRRTRGQLILSKKHINRCDLLTSIDTLLYGRCDGSEHIIWKDVSPGNTVSYVLKLLISILEI